MTRSILLFLTLCMMTEAATPPDVNYDESKVGNLPLPPLLQMADGSMVKDSAGWEKRRAEVMELLRGHLFGRTPEIAGGIKISLISEKADALAGLAHRKNYRVTLPQYPAWKGMEVMLHTPAAAKKPVPVFVGVSFNGNHAVTTDTDLPLSTTWCRESPKEKGAVVEHRFTELSRGIESSRWPLAMILKRGYAVATYYYGDVEPDHEEGWKDGLRAAVSPAGAATVFKPEDWGAIGAWAWGLSRALDVCAQDAAVDASHAACMGHSRLGKTSLWAGAQDTRFSIVISNNSGEGGAAIARRNFGERTARMVQAFPHWFCDAHDAYADNEAAMPYDAHMLIAVQAPRACYIASAEEDRWADPKGEFLSGLHASEVYALYGKTGVGVKEWPAVNVPVGDAIGYHLRTGLHDVLDYDWERYLDFADKHWK
jgi:hypothetical protein